MKKVTIKDIAALVGTSPKTVSKALNNKPGVSQELRQKIKETAEKLNYVPNAFGRGLSGKPLRTIGIIIPENSNPFYSFVLKGVEQQATEAGYAIILCNSNEDLEREQHLIQVLMGKHVDGMIISPAQPGINHNIERLQRLKIPYTLINRTISNQCHPCVKARNADGAYLAGQYLIRKGHRNVVCLTRQYSVTAVEERLQGFRRAFEEQNIFFDEEGNVYRRCQDINVESAYVAMCSILKERKNFSAVFAFNDIIAFGAMKAIQEYHLRIPYDIAVMGFDNIMFSDISLVPLTTVNQNLPEIGISAVEVLLQQIHGEFIGHYRLMPEPYIVERKSV
ncbi:LacI family transcriptional regulator [candidate division KSB3 bacterium]|uniref:LacI family transcriptional regulator n=1 Tax=candidate division KSB3 bacterium TaxID=2044937 RepID=A0A2G6KM79_9BACT|nr:MAG: LacI family transcriptional regulator [candidate division KSB3 bacterium]